MLMPRILTALVLLALLVPALWAASPLPFAALTLVLIGAAGWEWARLNGACPGVSLGLGALVTLLCGGAWAAGWASQAPAAVWWIATLCWVIGGGYALRCGPAMWPRLPQAARQVLGVVVLCAAWLALAGAHQRGLAFILSSLSIVWMADIAAYFGGRAFGRRKLAPTISPGKSWEGVWSGLTGVLLLAGALIAWERGAPEGAALSVFSTLWQQLGPGLALLAGVVLVALSVMGDLVESLIKRAVGAKDSSRLLPGHGGVLDRIDALLPVLPAVMAFTSV